MMPSALLPSLYQPFKLFVSSALSHNGQQLFSRSMAHKTDTKNVKVGFIGLGRMGFPMLTRLNLAGHQTVVYDTNQYAMDRALALGNLVKVAESPADVASQEGIDILFTMLRRPKTVQEVFLGPEGVLAAKGGPMPAVMVDCSTLAPTMAKAIGAEADFVRLNPKHHAAPGLKDKGLVTLMDAPVSGGVTAAEKGTLAFYVGGNEYALKAAAPYLEIMGSGGITYCGGHGAGQAAKLCATLAMAASMAATSEAIAMARRLGVDPKVMTAVLNSGAGQSWSSSVCNPMPGIHPNMPPSNGYKAGLTTDTVLDHLTMLVATGEHSHSPTPLARYLASELYSKVRSEGLGDKDFSSIFRYYYGSGSKCHEWQAGEQLFNSQVP